MHGYLGDAYMEKNPTTQDPEACSPVLPFEPVLWQTEVWKFGGVYFGVGNEYAYWEAVKEPTVSTI